ncbi:S-layer homology domain-containing protein [Paenibacillus sp. yr247]|uniref:S-layer homology domain-containing protein n=1 Tax=Paenibacillus sp. yr247 TaxID=1761880 RepID=UPI0015870D5B|nr:S-layer homology domain-containing protein [Paenibacillus sp. yr247]
MSNPGSYAPRYSERDWNDFCLGDGSDELRSWGYPDISPCRNVIQVIMAAAGIVNGYEDGIFKPSNSLTRAEAVTMINHYLGRTLTTTATSPTWADVPASHWAFKEIQSASQNLK